MKCEKLFATIDRLYEKYLNIWEDVCNIESPTADKLRVDAVGNYFSDFAKEKGWEVEILDSPTSGNVVCITLNPDVNVAPITFSAHMDTVYPVGFFGAPAIKREGDKIYGPGVTDCKGGLVAALLAMDALDRCAFRGRPVRFLLQSDEEGGSRFSNKATIRYMCKKALDSVAFINLEGGTEGKVCVERKGILTYLIKITGIEAHSSLCATDGANAIAAAATMISKLEGFKEKDGITCNCGTIKGGTTNNTVAGYCEFGINIRYANQEQREMIAKVVYDLASAPTVEGCTIEVEEYGTRPPMERVKRNLALLDTANEIWRENQLSPLVPAKGIGGSDAAEITEAGIPCLDNLGPIGGKIHSPEEFAIMPTLKLSAKRLASIAYCI